MRPSNVDSASPGRSERGSAKLLDGIKEVEEEVSHGTYSTRRHSRRCHVVPCSPESGLARHRTARRTNFELRLLNTMCESSNGDAG